MKVSRWPHTPGMAEMASGGCCQRSGLHQRSAVSVCALTVASSERT